MSAPRVGSTVRLADRVWILPNGGRVIDSPLALVLESSYPKRHRKGDTPRVRIRITDPSCPHDGGEGWIDADRLYVERLP